MRENYTPNNKVHKDACNYIYIERKKKSQGNRKNIFNQDNRNRYLSASFNKETR